ncbi:uncharacterized protein LOC118502382 [Anopheles stephensi]|uniref:uncharacterized protein LOC118502382 n=1 Tax=Anopheles stephensi TaxID=30069 RepID=UPI001658B28C|nr:uncharacterized protein LOC118502382 [Anopheles stephensi]
MLDDCELVDRSIDGDGDVVWASSHEKAALEALSSSLFPDPHLAAVILLTAHLIPAPYVTIDQLHQNRAGEPFLVLSLHGSSFSGELPVRRGDVMFPTLTSLSWQDCFSQCGDSANTIVADCGWKFIVIPSTVMHTLTATMAPVR